MGASTSLDVYLIRHGLTRYNLEKRYLGYTNEPLLNDHEEQFSRVKKALENVTFHYRYSSDLMRCIQTINHLIQNQPVCLDERLRELNFGNWEGHTYEMLKKEKTYQAWLEDMDNLSPPNGESFSKLQKRVDLFFEDLYNLSMGENQNILISTHGGVIMTCLLKFNITKKLWDFPVNYGSGYKLSLQNREGEWVCNSWSVVPIQENETSSNKVVTS
ncbi:histidine phosphatase family protein [Metabacillus litoralis]|uniref:histidine phosphatase family protein n=1 Tax=Metabacillus litoralis TaxID=152268 RepID=UPI001CFCD57C|nr:histidine phosphatase family protein [Metabacillus litoralis]